MFKWNTSLDHNRRVRRAEIAIYQLAKGVFRDSGTVVAASACIAMIVECSAKVSLFPPDYSTSSEKGESQERDFFLC